MRLDTAAIFAAALSALYTTPACAQRRRIPRPSPAVVINGPAQGSDAPKGGNAMIESVAPVNASLNNAAPANNNNNSTSSATPGAAKPTAPPLPPPPKKEPIPVLALLYAGSPGPKQCRGSPMVQIPIARPVVNTTAAPQCYNVPQLPANCGTFMAEKEDGCEARVFADWNCREFENLVVFMPELRPVGGIIRSVEVRCGVVGVEPAPLNLGALGAAKPKPKKKPGSR